jgi:hypothetical protein
LRRRACCRALAVALTALLVAPWPAAAYLKFGVEVDGRQVPLAWSGPVPYFISTTPVPNVTAVQLQDAVARAFATWQAVRSATIEYRFAGLTANRPGEDDGRSTLGFLNEPELDRVLAQTSFLVDEVTGELLESDIFFNSAVQWSTASGGDATRWDLESIAVHEIGHLSGLGHSAIGETEVGSQGRKMISSGTVMFPIALGPGNISLRGLQADDVAGISDIYPSDDFKRTTGSASGRITSGGAGVFGAHVVAFNAGTGLSVGSFTLSRDGRFSIAGLAPGSYALRVEPLDDADIDSFFSETAPVDIGFRTTYADHLVTVPRGGDSGPVTIAVNRK